MVRRRCGAWHTREVDIRARFPEAGGVRPRSSRSPSASVCCLTDTAGRAVRQGRRPTARGGHTWERRTSHQSSTHLGYVVNASCSRPAWRDCLRVVRDAAFRHHNHTWEAKQESSRKGQTHHGTDCLRHGRRAATKNGRAACQPAGSSLAPSRTCPGYAKGYCEAVCVSTHPVSNDEVARLHPATDEPAPPDAASCEPGRVATIG